MQAVQRIFQTPQWKYCIQKSLTFSSGKIFFKTLKPVLFQVCLNLVVFFVCLMSLWEGSCHNFRQLLLLNTASLIKYFLELVVLSTNAAAVCLRFTYYDPRHLYCITLHGGAGVMLGWDGVYLLLCMRASLSLEETFPPFSPILCVTIFSHFPAVMSPRLPDSFIPVACTGC